MLEFENVETQIRLLDVLKVRIDAADVVTGGLVRSRLAMQASRLEVGVGDVVEVVVLDGIRCIDLGLECGVDASNPGDVAWIIELEHDLLEKLGNQEYFVWLLTRLVAGRLDRGRRHGGRVDIRRDGGRRRGWRIDVEESW